MDILPCPETPSTPVERARYLCDSGERWDGGPFLSYLGRRSLRQTIPVPFSTLFRPAHADEQEIVYTTWLFFGLVAEFLGANGQENPIRPPDNGNAADTIEDVYRRCITEEDGSRYLTGKPIPELLPQMVALINQSSNIHARLQYLSECLHVSGKLIAWVGDGFDPTIRCAIAGLGELLTAMINTGLERDEFGGAFIPPFAIYWKSDYLAANSPARAKMIEAGWCKSDLNRIDMVYNTLSSVHYASRLQRHIQGREHSSCSETRCNAAQINNDTYRLSHTAEGCLCRKFTVDTAAVRGILTTSDTYPILAFSPDDDGTLCVKPFVAGDEYVAISHVWADGLGNTQENSLQKCQISRLRQLLGGLEKAVHASHPHNPKPNYHLWIDTLCCPVASLEPDLNNTAMMRMKTVYKQASQVLVLDLALLTHESKGVHPATLMLRIMASSIWMRRLWTLQAEGVLAQSLYFQFRDQPVHPQTLLRELPRNDARFKSVIPEISGDWYRLEQLMRHNKQGVGSGAQSRKMFQMIHAALNFRSVSYASDEPICIANLLGLDLNQILSVSAPDETENDKAEKRMCVLWRLIAEADNGIPCYMLFSTAETLATPGMQWAPRSLLGNKAVDAELTAIGTQAALSGLQLPIGSLTEFGLAVDLPGILLQSHPWLPELPLHVWDGLPRPPERVIHFYCAESNTWYGMADIIPPAPARPHTALTTMESTRPVCNAIDSGHVALIKSQDSHPHEAMRWLLVQILDLCIRPDGSGKYGYRVRWLRKVLVSEVHGLDLIVLNGLRSLSQEMACEPETQEFCRIREAYGLNSPEFDVALNQMLDKWFEKIAQCNLIPDFAGAVERTMGSQAIQFLWVSATARFPHQLLGHNTPADQRWYVD